MKIIVSHDVDHLYPRDHILRDLYFPKLWFRSIINFLRRKCKLEDVVYNLKLIFSDRLHHVYEVMELDKKYGVPSTFFWGMRSGLGMSYHSVEAKELMEYVSQNEFCIGVHGIEYSDLPKMKEEFDEFKKIIGHNPKGIRIHYVRYMDDTFMFEDQLGYMFDSTEFYKKEKGSIKAPYKVGNLWEFPLGLMDVYMPENLEEAVSFTIERINKFRARNIEYMTVLFHDNYFSGQSPFLKQWYEWFINYIANASDISVISFEDAIKELEGK